MICTDLLTCFTIHCLDFLFNRQIQCSLFIIYFFLNVTMIWLIMVRFRSLIEYSVNQVYHLIAPHTMTVGLVYPVFQYFENSVVSCHHHRNMTMCNNASQKSKTFWILRSCGKYCICIIYLFDGIHHTPNGLTKIQKNPIFFVQPPSLPDIQGWK